MVIFFKKKLGLVGIWNFWTYNDWNGHFWNLGFVENLNLDLKWLENGFLFFFIWVLWETWIFGPKMAWTWHFLNWVVWVLDIYYHYKTRCDELHKSISHWISWFGSSFCNHFHILIDSHNTLWNRSNLTWNTFLVPLHL